MKNPSLLLAMLLCYTMTFAQTLKEKRNAFPDKGTLYAKLNVTSLLDPRTPTIQPGIEYRFSRNMSGEFTVGIPARIWGYTRQTGGVYNKYYKVKAALKFVTRDKPYYIGPEVFYIHIDRNRYKDGYRNKDKKALSYQYAEIQKSVFGAAVKVGRSFRLSDNWHVDGFFAAGLRVAQMDIQATGISSSTGYRYLFYIPDREGTSITPHLAGGLSVMYTIF